MRNNSLIVKNFNYKYFIITGLFNVGPIIQYTRTDDKEQTHYKLN